MCDITFDMSFLPLISWCMIKHLRNFFGSLREFFGTFQKMFGVNIWKRSSGLRTTLFLFHTLVTK